MIDVISSLLAFVVAIAVLVAVHEFGHYWVARMLGFKVLRFSIGFGNPILKWRGKDEDRIEYWLSAIPLGGYVKLLDEREGPVPASERDRAFNRRPVPQRIAVLLAGPGFNFLFAIVAYWVMFLSGVPGIKPIVGAVDDGSIAAKAGLRMDDEIEAVGRRQTGTWEDALLAIMDELLDTGRIELSVTSPDGRARHVELDVRGRESELTEPDALFDGLGFEPGPTMPADIDHVDPDSPAEKAGLEAGDRVVWAASRAPAFSESLETARPSRRDDSPGGQTIQSWEQWLAFVRARPGESVSLRVLRDGREVELQMDIGEAEEDGAVIGRIGAWRPTQLPPELIERIRTEQRYGVVEGLIRGGAKTWEMTALTVRMLSGMLTGNVSLRNVSGPISIAEHAGASASAGFSTFLSFLAIVSISLGIMNLLPVPMLDGGNIMFQIAEWVKGSPLSEKAMQLGLQIGIYFLIILMGFVFYNDISRMFFS